MQLPAWGILACVVSVCACTATESEPTYVDARTYQLTEVVLGTTASEVIASSLDLDRDAEGRVDNAIGQIYAAFPPVTNPDLENTWFAGFADSGPPIVPDGLVFEVAVENPGGDGAARVRSFHEAAPAGDMLGTQSDDDQDRLVTTTDLAPLFLPLGLDGDPDAVVIAAGSVMFERTQAGEVTDCIIGGAFPPELIRPVWRAAVLRWLDTCEDCDETTSHFYELDTDNDGTVSVEEFGASSLIADLTGPDLDLYDEQGALNPNTDGVDDSLSYGFRCALVDVTDDP
jgi:hypothetical protein